MQIQLFGGKTRELVKQQSKQLTALQNQLVAFQRSITLNAGTQFVNSSIAKYPQWDTHKYTDLYYTMDMIHSIVRKVSETTSLIPFYPYIEKPDKKARRDYYASTNRIYYTTKGLFDIMLLQKKALEDTPMNDPLDKLLDTPNQKQTFQDVILLLCAYYLLNGEYFIWKYRISEGNNQGKVKELHVLPPSNIVVHGLSTYPYTITNYEFKVNGQRVAMIPPEDIIHDMDCNPVSAINGIDELRGRSRFESAYKLITVLDSGDDVAAAQLQNGGLPGIVYDESITHDEIKQGTLDEQRKVFYDFITNKDNKGAPYFTVGKKGYIATGLKLADMELSEQQKNGFKRLCSLVNISSRLFNDPDASTYNNLETDTKQLYTNACLPIAYRISKTLNRGLAREFDDKVRVIEPDISGISELQDDMLKQAQILATLPITPTGDEMRSLFKFDATGDPAMQKPLVKSGYSFIEDIMTSDIPPVDDDLVTL